MQTAVLALSFVLAGTTCTSSAANEIEGTPSLQAEGTELVLQLSDGTQLRSEHLQGSFLQLQTGETLRIDAVDKVSDAPGRYWWAHEPSVQTPGGWRPLCEPHSDGTHYAIVLPGREGTDGSLANDPFASAISCTGGALAKCLHLGYEPWQQGPDGQSMRATYNACVRMIRADYVGTGVPYTVNGRLIEVHDVHLIQLPDGVSEQVFEAGWDEHGAVCVNHVRVSGKITLQELEEAVPRLRHNVGAVCAEAHARGLGATVFNKSPLTRL